MGVEVMSAAVAGGSSKCGQHPCPTFAFFLLAMGVWEHWVSPSPADHHVVSQQLDLGQRNHVDIGPSRKF